MKPGLTRMILYVKDIMKVTGKSERASQYIASRIKKKTGVPFVSIDAFCEFFGLNVDTVIKYLND